MQCPRPHPRRGKAALLTQHLEAQQGQLWYSYDILIFEDNFLYYGNKNTIEAKKEKIESVFKGFAE